MKVPTPLLSLCLALAGDCASAVQIAYEPFAYTAAAPVTDLEGGSGWDFAWTQDGESCVTAADGMSYTDASGSVLSVSGLAAETTGSATTRSFRSVGGGVGLNDVWISFLYRLPATNNKFEGVSFYRGATALFTVSKPSVNASANIFLGTGSSGGVNSLKGVFGTTHLVVLHLEDGAGSGGADKVSMYIDPLLTGNPSIPDAITQGANLDFTSVRIAGQDGATLLVDELRIGESFADVTPHVAAGAADSDGDGLSDAQEALLGLDPQVSNTALIAAIKAHPDYFDLYTSAGILAQTEGGVVLQKSGNNPVSLTFEIQQSTNLVSWPVLETVTRPVSLPSDKSFLRVTLQNP
ncbi:thrombospondin type 3 repeat-containing protein [Haloferula sp. BvORR071]|uniref:thrombospondin type 3 repeat-containing protein n=1 Tax=Haloferula sp. BvORR071 TaxID=1396141 RepID=UPI000558658F|nr:thrombospondin type 3 repeat-containing protein [Haloferula sp. BvORR071]